QRRLDAGGLNRLDAYDIDFHHRVRTGYLEMVQVDPSRWVVINADQTFDQVQCEIRENLQCRLDDWGF
ncbi:MAG: dTMP kinase, partial [Anaerolineales bacterium]